MKHDLLSFSFAMDTLVPEVFLDFSSRKRSRASREAATTSRESDEEREKNLWLPWPRISLSCRRQGQDLTLGRWLVDIFSNTQTNLIDSFNCNYGGDAEDFHTSFYLSLPCIACIFLRRPLFIFKGLTNVIFGIGSTKTSESTFRTLRVCCAAWLFLVPLFHKKKEMEPPNQNASQITRMHIKSQFL